MNHDSEKWLDDRISEDVNRMADKRIDELGSLTLDFLSF